MLQFFSSWCFVIFIIWENLYKSKSSYSQLINPYYLSIVAFVGWCLHTLYNVYSRHLVYSLELLMIQFVIHSPFFYFIFINKGYTHENALKTLIGAFILYLIYMEYKGKNIINTYFFDKQITKITDIPNYKERRYYKLKDIIS